jgi:hypothetical protein
MNKTRMFAAMTVLVLVSSACLLSCLYLLKLCQCQQQGGKLSGKVPPILCRLPDGTSW